ncbi:hypothetical protein FRC06_005682 [Ceratobasidium sp. 370]|nr:hypothetical protein FRC06_005682 [Ceratobasidium sp. 370]
MPSSNKIHANLFPTDPTTNMEMWGADFGGELLLAADPDQPSTFSSHQTPTQPPHPQGYVNDLDHVSPFIGNLALSDSGDPAPPPLTYSEVHPILGTDFPGSHSRSLASSKSSGTRSSDGPNSQNYTIFTSVPSSSHSHAHTFLNMENASQHGAPTSTLLEHMAMHFLHNDPIHLSPAGVAELFSSPYQPGDRWANHEKCLIITFFFGPSVQVPANSPLPMSTWQSPKEMKHVAEEWVKVRAPHLWKPVDIISDQLSTDVFHNKHAPLALAQQWAPLQDAYCKIFLTFSQGPQDTAATILGRVRKAVKSANILSIAGLQMKTADLMVWIDGGENSWFSMVHAQYSFT